MDKNQLFFGDNLTILRQYVTDESVDLVYLDPPFNSNADYNVLFAEHDQTQAASQIKAFEDTWIWDQIASRAYDEFVVAAPHAASQALHGFRSLLGCNPMLAYLTMMAVRLVELRRVLSPTGSLYLHCDPTASHYLKILMDSIFGPKNFRNELIWKRTFAHGGSRRFGPVHDTILFYSKSDSYIWNNIKQPYGQSYLESKYRFSDDKGRYRLIVLTGAGVRHGDSGKPWRGYDPTRAGRHWAMPKALLRDYLDEQQLKQMSIQQKLDFLDEKGLVYFAEKGRSGEGGVPQLKFYLGEGSPVQDIIADIPPINSQAQERLGYPTQKPEALLERLIGASSNEGCLVLDPFCGCGTAIAVAQRLNRKWVGIDITHLAIALIKTRLKDAYGPGIVDSYKVTGEPVMLPDAVALAAHDRYQFQYWALGLLGARPIQSEQKKGADKGVDGRLYFHDDRESGRVKQVIFSVKSGHLKNEYVRELPGVLTREQAQIGVLVTLEAPTKPMRTEAASAGFYQSPWGTRHPRVQILTIEDILAGKQVDLPPSQDFRTFKKAPKATGKAKAKAKAKKLRPDYCQMSLISSLDEPVISEPDPDALRAEMEEAGIDTEAGGPQEAPGGRLASNRGT